MSSHPELEAEQAYIDHAYECLEASRVAATKLSGMVEVGRGGTMQARYEREVINDHIANRLRDLELGSASLVFGRLDHEPDGAGDGSGRPSGTDDGGADGDGFDQVRPAFDSQRGGIGHADGSGNGDRAPAPRGGRASQGDVFYIGRLAVADEHQEPIVVDWRAPVAEPFYRATGRAPMGLARRRHFASRGRQLLGIEDELFGAAARQLGGEFEGVDGNGQVSGQPADRSISGHGALIAALETTRSGKLTDIVATIQGEQDEIIRGDLPGILTVQGGPGTGKTVVALHRAAYLLYTHRFPLEGQGVLVVGPNRLFLGYIDQVLPSLGEAGVELAVLADLVPETLAVRTYDRAPTARIKGDLRMVEFLARAVRDRQRRLREPWRVGYGVQTLHLSVEASDRIVREARRRSRSHNAGRRLVEAGFYEALARSGRNDPDPGEVRERLHHVPEVREVLERIWPVLTPGDFLNDLLGTPALVRSAGRNGLLSEAEMAALGRRRSVLEAHEEIVFSYDDVPLLDEARALLGPRPRRRDEDEVRTYGHVVVDEAQDLSPMQLRMLARRSLNGSMTIVGDIAQATGAWAHQGWDEVLEHLPSRRPPRLAELTIGYRIPAQNMVLAARVLEVAAPMLQPPQSIREGGEPPRILGVRHDETLPGVVARSVHEELDSIGLGSLAVICPSSLVEAVSDGLTRAGIDHGRANRHGLDHQLTVVPVSLVKGLELDASIVVEPAAIVAEEPQGMRALYVALTRATKRLALVHARPLPDCLAE